jgi:mannose-1-phosphate guanylyltransferase
MSGKVWSLILAAGEGTRLSSLTTTAAGLSVPKQFCSLRGGASLLEEALARGESVTSRHRVLAVVADYHRRWWEGPLWSLPPENVIVQPENRGTAAGLLLPLLHIVARDPRATVLVLPSDHFVLDEARLARTLQRAVQLADEDRRHVYLLGLAPLDADPELGYIVPSNRKGLLAAARVQRFVEKPAVEAARLLISEGALLNMFIIAASARALLRLYAARYPDLVAEMAEVVERDRLSTQDAAATHQLYPRLPTLDFSRHVLEGQEPWLRMVTAPDCGWSDLGTPRRVAETLARIGVRLSSDAAGAAYISLAEQYALQQRKVDSRVRIDRNHA